jgi:hypothetical protein
MSDEDFMSFKNGNLTKEEVIAKYHKPRIESYIRKENVLSNSPTLQQVLFLGWHKVNVQFST